MIQMLKDKNKDWNDLSIQLKRGSYFQRKKVKKLLTFDEIEKLPLLHNARKNPNIEIEHFQCIELINFFSIKNIINSKDMIFNFIDPIISDKYKINYDEMNQ